MSNVGQIVGGVVGAVVGFYTGGPVGALQGAALGLSIGSVVFPTKLDPQKLPDTYGKRLNEIGFSGSTYNTPIPRVFGGYRFRGNLVWQAPIAEFSRSTTRAYEVSDGKDTDTEYQTTTSYYYKNDFLVQVCRGPVRGIGRIWFDKKLVYENVVGGTGVGFSNGTVSFYLGTEGQTLPNDLPTSYRGTVVILFRNVELTDYGNRLPIVEVETFGIESSLNQNGAIIHNNASTAQIVSQLCLDAGLEASEIDVSGLADDYYGFASAEGVLSNTLQPILQASSSITSYSGDKVTFRQKYSDPVVVIPKEEVGVTVDGSGSAIRLKATRAAERALPRGLKLSYIDKDRSHDTNVQTTERMTSRASSIREIAVDIVMSANKAAQLSEILLYTAWQERTSFRFHLGIKYLYLEPGDVVTVETDSGFQDILIVKMELGADGSILCDGTSYSKHTLETIRQGSTFIVDKYVPPPSTPTVFQYWNAPALLTSQDQPGIYIGAHGVAADGWYFARLFKAYDAVNYSYITSIGSRGIFGISDTLLSDTNYPQLIDYDNTLTLTVRDSDPLTSATLDELLANEGKNLFFIGDELIQAANVVFISADENAQTATYTLSTLIRGRFGTEYLTGTHAIGEKVAYVPSLQFMPLNAATDYENTFFIKAVSNEEDFNDVVDVTSVTSDFRSVLPYSPADVDATQPATDTLITWSRRARFGSSINTLGAVLPVTEGAEEYEIDILNGVDAVVRTLYSTVPSVTYTEADQIADFGSGQNWVKAKVYMMSQYVGRGTPSDILDKAF